MREILFRAKHVVSGEWVYGYYVNCQYPYDKEHHTGHFIVEYPDKMHEIYTSTIGQYTGLKDKNGKRIFEGDVIEGIMNDPLDPGATWRGTVVWYGSGWGEEEQNGGIGYLDEMSMVDEMRMARISVIGNIHDNPELLKGE